MRKRIFCTIVILACTGFSVFSQELVNRLTYDEVLQLAHDQSPQAILAKHRFRAAYWEYRTFVAEFRPSLTLDGTLPSFSRSFVRYQNSDGSYDYIEDNTNTTSLGLTVKQNIGLTGGNVFIQSDLERTDVFSDSSTTSYLSKPVLIGFSQPLFGMNKLKWSKKIEPIKYEEAKRTFIEAMENISIEATQKFFDLAMAQQNLETAKLNYSNTDTLYKIAQGRYNIGTIAENDLLQMELSNLNAGTSLNEAIVDLQLKKNKLKSYLGLNDKYDLEIILPEEVPNFDLQYDSVLRLSMQNNPQILSYERQLIEADRDVAQARADRGFSANLYATYGLTQRAQNFDDVYVKLKDLQTVQIGVSIPIVDWGLGKGKVKMAQSNREVVRTTIQQAYTDFEQDIFLRVMQFNRQDDQVKIAQKADLISQNRYEVTKQRFLIGKIDVLDLNVAQSERDEAKQKYINTLSNYWQYFYQMRSLTLYDLEKNEPIKTDFDLLLK
ncbi:MAG: TolC family protein [Bacteroidales bacterium]|nr:TolC family protein [Bacteroidales bacterium]HPD95053.1 TolC family protein [Tenuifilaceae bacterium]HRX32586.1 TolC family protein [Tenuifilaceae bacterium]